MIRTFVFALLALSLQANAAVVGFNPASKTVNVGDGHRDRVQPVRPLLAARLFIVRSPEAARADAAWSHGRDS